MLVKSSLWKSLSFFSESCYARGFVGVLFEAVKYCFGSILPVQHQIHRGLPSTVLDIEVGAIRNQESDHLVPVQPHGVVQGGISFSVLGVEVCLTGNEMLCTLVVASPHRHVQRCAEQLIPSTDFCSFVQQQF